jgi:hypothetical protein
LRLLVLAGLFAAVLLCCPAVFSQNVRKDSIYTLTDSMRYATGANNGIENEIITTFQGLNFPPEMLAHYGEITPEDAITLTDEFQVTQKDEDGVPILITVKLHFDSDHLVGYIIEAPIEKTIDVTVSEFIVKIPVEWLCTPEKPDHPEQYKCTGWHIKLPERQRPILKKRSKKEKKPKKDKPVAKPATQ